MKIKVAPSPNRIGATAAMISLTDDGIILLEESKEVDPKLVAMSGVS